MLIIMNGVFDFFKLVNYIFFCGLMKLVKLCI